ncbi:unnamed protein product [Vicia faba]|uniref:Uncharacterized protein n=1 Tax=Vicia faba TaxID=3906 RepID=A0AAV0YZG1_VICFA|nr:unnamed protein product [Vicia faba]
MTVIVRGTLVSNSVKLLLEKFVSTEFVDNFGSTKLEVSYLKKLKTTLTWVQDILNDAEEQNVFEVANLLDEINTEALRRKAEAEYEILTSSSLVLKTIFSPFKRLSSVINFKMQKFIERLEWLNSALQQGGLAVFHSSTLMQGEQEVGSSSQHEKKELHYPCIHLFLFTI